MISLDRIFALALVLLAVAVPARADLIVAPNANASVEGDASTFIVFSVGPATFQWVFDDSQFSGLALGSKITGIGFRLNMGGATGPTSSTSFGQWDLQISQSLNAPGALSHTFANNIAADVVLVRSGPLTLGANSLTGGAGANPFTTVAFTLPYTYTGGDLLVTLRHSGSGADVALQPTLDAVDVPLAGTDSAGTLGDASATTAGRVSFFNVPVTQFVFESATVLAPATLALLGLGFAGLGWSHRRK